MTVAWKHPLLVAIAAFAMGCQTEDQASEQGSETEPAVDLASVEQAIQAVDQAWEDAFKAGDAAAIAALYTSDAVALPPNAGRLEGTSAIQDAFGAMIAQSPGATIDLRPGTIEVAESGDLAYEIGTYTMSGTSPDGTTWSDEGKYVEIFQNVNGEWKIATDIWNSDTPLPGTEPAPGTESAGTEEEPAPSE